jgi:hypothetical protein
MYVYITKAGKNDIRAKGNGNTSALGKKLADGVFTAAAAVVCCGYAQVESPSPGCLP